MAKQQVKWTIEKAQAKCKRLGVELLNNTYYEINDKYHFKCACGKTFERRLSEVIHKNSIYCSSNCDKNIEKLKEIQFKCEKLGIEILDKTYHGQEQKHKFKCECGETFKRKLNEVIEGNQIHCLDCNNKHKSAKLEGSRKPELEEARLKCKELGVELLDNTYHGEDQNYQFKCKCSEIFIRELNEVLHHKKTYCDDCVNQKELDDVQLKCSELNLEILDTIYQGMDYKYQFQCERNHLFEKELNEVLQQKENPCPKCQLEEAILECMELNVGLSEETTYQGVNHTYIFECACGTTFERKLNEVLDGNNQCSHCVESAKRIDLEESKEIPLEETPSNPMIFEVEPPTNTIEEIPNDIPPKVEAPCTKAVTNLEENKESLIEEVPLNPEELDVGPLFDTIKEESNDVSQEENIPLFDNHSESKMKNLEESKEPLIEEIPSNPEELDVEPSNETHEETKENDESPCTCENTVTSDVYSVVDCSPNQGSGSNNHTNIKITLETNQLKTINLGLEFAGDNSTTSPTNSNVKVNVEISFKTN